MTIPLDPRTHPAGGRRPVVLFIEDNLTQLDLYAMLIEHELAVVKASRGLTGFDLAISERPDVIVLDLLLPDIDGFALAERLRMNPATMSIPIVVLTGDDAAFARAEAIPRFRDVLMKPCPADRLLGAIHHARGA
jgi:CheY-like chemotaxis protein